GDREAAARVLTPIRDDLDVIENQDYHQLLLLYRGRVAADTLLAAALKRGGVRAATVGYGVAGWRIARREPEAAMPLLQAAERGESWSGFGHIAAGAGLH